MRGRPTLLIATTLLALVSSGFGHGRQPMIETPPAATSGRLALVIANAAYPDAEAPLAYTRNDGAALAATLLRNGYDVTFIRDATREQTSRAVEQLESKVRPGSTVFVWFGGYGVQSRGTNYLRPADSAIWVERDVRTCGLDLSGLLSELQQRGAVKRIALVDASRRNPFERRFRSYSHGLAPMPGSSDELIGFALPPNVVADEVPATRGPFGTSLLGALNPSSSQTDSGAVDVPAAVAAEITADRVFSPTTAARNASSTSGKDASS